MMQLGLKRLIDISVAGSAILLLSPLFILISLIVFLDLGRPILFKQRRLGLKGRPFWLLKFRTMTADTDRDGKLLSDDLRVTRLSTWLRNSSFDELPELFNVVRGDMSIVGPRPLLPEYWAVYSPEQRRRHEMPPGMAGPVMAKGRNLLGWEEKFALDVWYVDHWSLWLDLKLFVLSVYKALSREGATPEGAVTMEPFRGEERPARKPDE